MRIFKTKDLHKLISSAQQNSRFRQHYNIHRSYLEPVQRLFNAIGDQSYIRPHRHLTYPRDEMLVPICGLMAVFLFNDHGEIKDIIYLGTENYDPIFRNIVEVSPSVWHTVVALTHGCVLLEIKAGPFEPSQRKDLASWAPQENTEDGKSFLSELKSKIDLLEPF